jgi:hypothetical protein
LPLEEQPASDNGKQHRHGGDAQQQADQHAAAWGSWRVL